MCLVEVYKPAFLIVKLTEIASVWEWKICSRYAWFRNIFQQLKQQLQQLSAEW